MVGNNQYVHEYNLLDYNEIMWLYRYYPWHNESERDNITSTILNLKKDNSCHGAAKYFSKVLTNPNRGISRLVNSSEDNLFCIVPSHKKNKLSIGMMEIMRNVRQEFNFINRNNLLRRHQTVEKAAYGGSRDAIVHRESICIDDSEQIDCSGKNIFLFDDVTTTGNSLKVCRFILMKNLSPKNVIMIALAKTESENE